LPRSLTACGGQMARLDSFGRVSVDQSERSSSPWRHELSGSAATAEPAGVRSLKQQSKGCAAARRFFDPYPAAELFHQVFGDREA